MAFYVEPLRIKAGEIAYNKNDVDLVSHVEGEKFQTGANHLKCGLIA